MTTDGDSGADGPALRFVVVTLFPSMFDALVNEGVVGAAFRNGTAALETVNPRDFATDRHRTVDDAPYGGGPGMVLKPEPLAAAIDRAREIAPGLPVCNMSPQGRALDDSVARGIAGTDGLVILCGRYAGIDQRVIDSRVDFELSVGDYVVSGGELPAMTVIDAAMRHVPGVLGSGESADADSFSAGRLAPPCYTRPEEFEGMRVPEVLLGGNHGEIGRWRSEKAERRTQEKGGAPLPWQADDAGSGDIIP